MPAERGIMKRGSTRAVQRIDIRTRVQQHFHDLAMTFQRSVVKQRAAAGCYRIRIGTLVQQQRDHVHLPAHNGILHLAQRGVLASLAGLIHQQAHNLAVLKPKSIVQRCDAGEQLIEKHP